MIAFALRRPIALMVVFGGIALAALLAVRRMPVDIFPEMDAPAIYVVQPYGGMDAAQMEGYLTNYTEFLFLYISGIHHVESKNIQNIAFIKLSFHPGTNMAQALAETVNYINRSKAWQPPGTVPPIVVRYDAGSVPVGYLVFSSSSKNIGEIQDEATFRVRPLLSSFPGVSAPPAFGGEARTIVLNLDPERLRAYSLSPDAVLAALTSGNQISPSGTLNLPDKAPIVPINSVVTDIRDLGKIPVRFGNEPVYLRDIGVLSDSTDIPVGYALVNGRRSVFLPITKRPDASTLSVVRQVKENLPQMRAALSEDIQLRFEFDQSPYVTRAMTDVLKEGLLGAFLAGAMVLLFLRDARSAIVVVLNIPLALLAAVVALWATGQTINIMTLGGLTLAVGILVDESTVAVENIHVCMGRAASVAWAVRQGTEQTLVPRLLAMLCILAVFIPSFFMEGAIRGLFVPLSLAVGFSMIASYLLSNTFVPILGTWLLRASHRESSPTEGVLGRLSSGYDRLLRAVVSWRWMLVPAYLAIAVLSFLVVGNQLGREIFPAVDAGQFQLRLRAPAGTRLDHMEELTRDVLKAIGREVGEENVDISIALVGTASPNYPINFIFLWTAGSHEALLRVSLKHGCGVRIEELKERLRRNIPELVRSQLPSMKDVRLSFEAGDIVTQVLSFGAPTPIEVDVSGPKFSDTRAYADKVRIELERIPALRDLQVAQALDYPAVKVEVDRERAGMASITAQDVARSMLAATSSSRYVLPNFWADPESGIGYQVQIQIPPARMNAVREVEMVPIRPIDAAQVLLRDVAKVREGTMPGEYDRYNMRRMVSLQADLQGSDLGRVATEIDRALQRAGEPPRGVTVDVRGQVVPMREMFRDLQVGLGMTVIVVLLFLTAYFQSFLLALVAVSAVPAVLAGSTGLLFATHTTLNIQSFMGTIMAIGVALANAILLVTFAERRRLAGSSAIHAAFVGARERLRPILMTSCAMLAGMFPMALGIGEGGEQMAALGRAVIGGLSAATLTTLLLLPAVFALLRGNRGRASCSLDPADPASRHYGPPYRESAEAT
jgi:multidrug efflux pump subunit AcrB